MTDELAARRKRPPFEHCTARSKRTGKRCGLRPAVGQKVCQWHGAHPRDIEAAKLERRIRGSLPPPEEWVYTDPLEESARLRAEADAWRETCWRMLDKVEDFEVTSVVSFGDGGKMERVGAELRAIAKAYTDAIDRCFRMAAEAVRLGLAQKYTDQLERQSELFAMVLAESLRMLDLPIPPERYAVVVPAAIAAVRAEVAG